MMNNSEILVFIGDRLRKIRKDLGVSQRDVSKTIGLPQSNLSRIENGKQRINLSVLTQILGVYRLSLNRFFSVDEEIAKPLDDDERNVLATYRSLPPHVQKEVKEFLEFKSSIQQSEDMNDNHNFR